MSDTGVKVLPLERVTSDIENKLKQTGQWDELLSRLGQCSNDFERMKVVLGSEEVLSQINVQIKGYKAEVKNAETADKLRSAGNECFKSAQYQKAFDLYSEAVCHAPPPDQDGSSSSILALCFGNRSATLFHMKRFDHCLQDISNALQTGVPASSLQKLLDRKGKCLLFLKQKRAAVEAFQDSKQALLADSSLEDKAKQDLLSLTESFITKCKGLRQAQSDNMANSMLHEHLPSLVEHSTQIPCATKALKIRDDENRGRGLYATREIKIGEILIIEKPYSSVVISSYKESHCHECCSRCFVPLPCELCVDVVFCSIECREAAHRNGHGAECGLLSLLHHADVRLGHLAYRMVAKAGYQQLMNRRSELEQPKQLTAMLGCDDRGVYDSENYATMYHLLGHSEKRQLTDLFNRSVKAAYLVSCLAQTSFFPKLNRVSEPAQEERIDMCYIGSHILRHLMMLPCNAHEVSEMAVNWREPSQSQTLEIGSGIYPVLSLINHSCDPSVVRHSYGSVCVVRAIRGIAAGEELCDNYGSLYPVMEKVARQQHLQNQYFFTCACQACINNWPMYMDIPKDLMYFYCQKCHGRVPMPDILLADKADKMECLDCGHGQNIRNIILKIGQLEQSYQDALHKVIFRLETDGDTLPRLVQFLRQVDKNVHRPFSAHNDCQEAIKMCFAFKANAFPRMA